MVDATVRLFEEKRGDRAQICSLQSSENVNKSRKPIDFCVLSLWLRQFSVFSSLFFYFFRGKDFIFCFIFCFGFGEEEKREREREREKASDYGDDNESAALERKGGWAEKARSEVSTLLSNSSYFV